MVAVCGQYLLRNIRWVPSRVFRLRGRRLLRSLYAVLERLTRGWRIPRYAGLMVVYLITVPPFAILTFSPMGDENSTIITAWRWNFVFSTMVSYMLATKETV